MLKAIDSCKFDKPPCIRLADADKTELFPRGLEYNAPARGVWNIVHMGLLVPESHQVYVCAQGCLRGVALTVAETDQMDRLSWVSLSEEDMFDGTLESDVSDGVSEVIEKLPYRPRAVLIFLSCMHLFAGADYEVILDQLREKHPDIDFVDCYMTPTMRETFSPTVWLTKRMYSLIKPLPLDSRSVSIIGCDRATDENSELVKFIRDNGYTLRDLNCCKTYDEFMQLGSSAVNISYLPTALAGCRELSECTGAVPLHLPNAFDFEVLSDNYRRLCEALGIEMPDLSDHITRAEQTLEQAAQTLGEIPVAIDFTAVTRPFELALLLCRKGLNVRYIISDSVGEDSAAFETLKSEHPDIKLYSSVNVNMLHAADEAHEPVLAIGQKAAWFFATDNFVDIVSNGGLYGFAGIVSLCGLITDAFKNKKDRRTVIQQKGWGCSCNAQV